MHFRSVIVLIFGLLFFVQACQIEERTDVVEERIPKIERIEGKFEHEFEITKDPQLGIVPRERLFKAGKKTAAFFTDKKATFELEWEERGPSQIAGRTRAILFDLNDPSGSTVFAGGVGGGLWRNPNIKDPQQAWEKVGDAFENIAVTSIAQDPSQPDVMYFGTGEGYGNLDAIRGLGIWRSLDGGANWAPAPGSQRLDFEYIQKMITAPDGSLLVASKKGLYVSDDKGESFRYLLGENRQAESNEVSDVDLSQDGTLYAAIGMSEGEGIYRRDPGADNFSKLNLGLRNQRFERIEMAVSPSNPNRLFALIEGDGGECGFILRSDNRGDSWQQMPVPGAIGMSNFARNQAWYDLTLEFDPSDEDRLFIGGIDLLLTEDGGMTWNQISQWFGRTYQEVHADQHNIVINPFDSRQAIFSNDGGVYYCKDITASMPAIVRCEIGYNTTQYYAADMHPNDDNFLLGGTQDNGSHILDQSGMNIGREVTGGDGAFCHIDQEDPNIIITSYIYSSYFISINGGADFRNVNFGGRTGRFINPTDYDSKTKTLYANFRAGNFLRLNGIDVLNTSEDIIEVDTFNNSSISAIKVSPNVSDRVYFALSSGRLIYVDNASQVSQSVKGVELAPELVDDANISSIAIAEGNEDHIILTYSNYGVPSVWETRDGGQNWENIENDLPDMPVRWGIFAPDNNDVFLIATEMGVWMTDNLDGANTDWFPTNRGLANTRVDMLVKNQNGTVLAATHGRGMFTTNSFKTLNISFAESQSYHFTSDENNICVLDYDTLLIDIKISKLPDNEVDVKILQSADWPADLILLDSSLVFSSSDSSTTKFIRIIKEKNSDLGEHLSNASLSIEGAPEYELGAITSHRLMSVENFLLDENESLTFVAYNQGNSLKEEDFLNKEDNGTKIELMWRASELIDLGLGAGPIDAIELYSLPGLSDSVTIDITLTAGEFNFEEFPRGLPFSSHSEVLFSNEYVWRSGINKMVFDQPFMWDGQSNISFQFCVNNHQELGDLELIVQSTSEQRMVSSGRPAGSDPCRIFSPQRFHNYRPIVGFEAYPALADDVTVPFESAGGGRGTVIIDSTRQLLSIMRAESEDLCGEWSVGQYSWLSQPEWIQGQLSDRVFSYSRSVGNGPMKAEIYFPKQSYQYFSDSLSIELLQCNQPIEVAGPDDCKSFSLNQLGYYPVDSALVVNVTSDEPSTYWTLFSGQLVNNTDPIMLDLAIGPVPFADVLQIQSEELGEISVYNTSGVLIVKRKKTNQDLTLTTATWPSGIYYIQLSNEKGNYTAKVVK